MQQQTQTVIAHSSDRLDRQSPAASASAPTKTADDRAFEQLEKSPDGSAVSLKVAARYQGISVSTYRRQAKRGEVPPIVSLSPGRVGVIVGPLRDLRRARKEVA